MRKGLCVRCKLHGTCHILGEEPLAMAHKLLGIQHLRRLAEENLPAMGLAFVKNAHMPVEQQEEMVLAVVRDLLDGLWLLGMRVDDDKVLMRVAVSDATIH